MWILAGALFMLMKGLTLWRAQQEKIKTTHLRRLAYVLGWPGMNFRDFLNLQFHPPITQPKDWLRATLKMGAGVICFWIIPRFISSEHSLLQGWIGFLGILFLLHFGFFHLLALIWQAFGIQATPIMEAPILAASLKDFWGNRWNRAFRDFSHEFIFTPSRKGLGNKGAVFVVFLFSGIFHDLVISVPAQGGYGLPTLYFLIQGFGSLLEQSHWAKEGQFFQGWRGRFFTVLCTLGPLALLFHPLFIRHVILPFMKAGGAL